MKILPAATLLALLFAIWSGSACSARAQVAATNPPNFYVANWNVENLYDAVDDPDNEGDDEFLPNNPTTQWTQVRYETKLDNLAQVISQMNNGNGPDVLGLEEVENENVIQDLVDRIHVKPYGIVHVDSPDPRGIDTALIFNRNHFNLQEFHAYKVNLKWDHTTRDILHAVLEDHEGTRLHVFVNHWPSRGGGVKMSEPNRFEAARTLALALDRVFLRDPAARVVILGDFNDEPTSRSIRDVLDVEFYPSRSGTYVATNLYNLALPKSTRGQGSFSQSFEGETEWRMYDQIIVSGALLQDTSMEQDPDFFRVDKPVFMVEEHGEDRGAPVPTFENMEDYQGGYSDHFPVGARFVHLVPAEPAAAEAPAELAAPAEPAPAPAVTTPVPPATQPVPRVAPSLPAAEDSQQETAAPARTQPEHKRPEHKDWVIW